jgi:hypothetical protein
MHQPKAAKSIMDRAHRVSTWLPLGDLRHGMQHALGVPIRRKINSHVHKEKPKKIPPTHQSPKL